MKDMKQSETIIIKRSQINFAPYNPKRHSKEAIKEQKKNFERVGFLGGIVWNPITGNLISGHKRIMALDSHFGYDGTPEKDYEVKVERFEMDEKAEKEQNIYMDAHGTNTRQDADLLAAMLPDIDYKNAGLSDEDLQLIGIDFTMQTDGEKDITSDIEELMAPVQEQKQVEKEQKIAHNKAVKAQVREAAKEKAENMDAYVVISFQTYQAKEAFMRRFSFDPREKYITGELFGYATYSRT